MDTEETKERESPPKISPKFAAALAAAQAEMGHAEKDGKVDIETRKGRIKYSYPTFASCLDVVRPAWSKQGISYTFDTEQEICDVDYEDDHGNLRKRRGALVKVSIVLYFEAEQRPYKPTILSVPSLEPKGIGSALTYAKRQQVTSAAGIAAEEDDDGGHAQGDAAPQEPRTPRADRPPPAPPRDKPAPRAAQAPKATGPDPAAVALNAEFGRRIKEVGDLAGQVDLRVQIRASEAVDKAALIEESFHRSIELATTPEERKPIAIEIRSDPLDEQAKTRLNKAYRGHKAPAPAQTDNAAPAAAKE